MTIEPLAAGEATHAAAGLGPIMAGAVVLLAATVIAIPLFRRLGLGSVLGYFAAGLAVGPFGLGMFDDPESMLHVSELGVVLFLFIIGLEMRPERLWSMRRQIFGLGLAQLSVCTALLTGAAMAFGYPWAAALIAAAGFVLSSTAVVMSVMQEDHELATPDGQRNVSILLMEDMMIVPLLALVAVLSPLAAEGGSVWVGLGIGLAALAALIAAGRWLLDPMFALLARAGSREAMSAGALLVVLAAALLMDTAGLSMAMGAFIAGVMLSGSSYRHQIEADIEPFRGMLMGLFFLAVGMSLDLGVVAANAAMVVALVLVFMAVKSAGVYTVARLTGSTSHAAIRRMALFAQGGEFAFVLYAAARTGGVFTPEMDALFGAVVILSMALTPLILIALRRLLPPQTRSLDGVDTPNGLHGNALLIGFGRFGQMASQGLLARGHAVSIIDADIEMIEAAETLGFKVYYGDGTRLDILHASGAAEAQVILICVDSSDAMRRIVEIAKAEFPQASVLARAYDRRDTIWLRAEGVAYSIRETVESALDMARASLIQVGTPDAEADEIIADLRARDRERLALQLASVIASGPESMVWGRELLHSNIVESFKE